MTLLENLQSHKGGLIRLKTELFWYGGRGWDGETGRVCLILDAVPWRASRRYGDAAAMTTSPAAAGRAASALLLIDGAPRWIWVAEVDVEVIDDPA